MVDRRRLERIWEGEAEASAPLRIVLAIGSVAWGLGRRLHRALYAAKLRRRVRLPCPVISVGNVTVGGSGKTPCVAALARMLAAKGKRVVVLARGYGRQPGAKLNEEGEWLAAALPSVRVIQDPDRAGAAKRALAESPADVVLLDDGFQHERLERDLDLVLVDATFGFGNGKLLPAGPLRERPEALARADFAILTRCELADDEEIARARAALLAAAPGVLQLHARLDLSGLRHGGEKVAPYELKGRELLLATGVGRPSAVARTVSRLGAVVVDHVRFPDHHAYTRAEVEELLERAGAIDVWLATTEKDAVKWDALCPDRRGDYIVLEQGFALTEGRERFEARLEEVVAAAVPVTPPSPPPAEPETNGATPAGAAPTDAASTGAAST
jgi:tetraacyldisaccharide 4'-kinase